MTTDDTKTEDDDKIYEGYGYLKETIEGILPGGPLSSEQPPKPIKKGGPDALDKFRPAPHRKETAEELKIPKRDRGEHSYPF